jgi:hypothetical protein
MSIMYPYPAVYNVLDPWWQDPVTGTWHGMIAGDQTKAEVFSSNETTRRA